MSKQQATFAAGCFWGVEQTFRKLDGVLDTRVGYTGGTTPDPTYRDVCGGDTGHAEAVRVDFDPDQISYEDLLETFWSCHNPTQRNRQGPDVGSQYRSAVFFHSPEQEESARASKDVLGSSGQYVDPIATEISPATTFFEAEEYHQRYLEKNGGAACSM